MEPSKAQRQPPLVLVADDVASLRLLYTTLLTGEGYRVVEARDGIEALARIRSDRPALAILDISMPRLDGMRVLEELRKAGDETPVLVITAHKDRETVLAAAQRGIVSYLTKPINIADFRERVRRTLMERESQKTAATPPGEAEPVLDPESRQWLETAPASGWDLARFDRFLQASEDLEAAIASIALAADAAIPREPTRAERIARMPASLALAMLLAAFERGDAQVRAEVAGLLPSGLPEDQRRRILSLWAEDPSPPVRGRASELLAALGRPPGGEKA